MCMLSVMNEKSLQFLDKDQEGMVAHKDYEGLAKYGIHFDYMVGEVIDERRIKKTVNKYDKTSKEISEKIRQTYE